MYYNIVMNGLKYIATSHIDNNIGSHRYIPITYIYIFVIMIIIMFRFQILSSLPMYLFKLFFILMSYIIYICVYIVYRLSMDIIKMFVLLILNLCYHLLTLNKEQIRTIYFE